MPKLSKMYKWSNARSERVFKERSRKMVSDLLDKTYPYVFEKNESLNSHDRDEMAKELAEIIFGEYLSDDFVALAKSFDPDVNPQTVDNTQDILEALRTASAD